MATSLSGVSDSKINLNGDGVHSLAGVSVSNGDNASLKITLIAAGGKFGSSSKLSFTGSPSAVNEWLDDVEFTPNGKKEPKISFVVFDGDAYTKDVLVLNTAPVVSGLPTSQQEVRVGKALDLKNFKVSDTDGTTILDVTLLASNGEITNVTDEDTEQAGIQLSGKAAVINAAIAKAKLVAAESGSADIQVTVSDGAAADVVETYDLNAWDAAKVSNLPGKHLNVEKGVLTSLINFEVSNGETSGEISVTVAASGGTVSGLTDADSAKSGIQLVGTAAEITTALQSAQFSSNKAGKAAIKFSVTDETGLVTKSQYDIKVLDAAKAPVISGVSTEVDGVAVGEDVSLDGVTVADGSASLTLTLKADGVVLDTGALEDEDANVAGFQIKGNASEITDALGGISFALADGNVSGSLSLSVSDGKYVTTDSWKIEQAETGRLSDGYISGATVFADANGDGVWNTGEARATTNTSGRFQLKGAEGTIIASGGTDVSTNQAFVGVLKAPSGSSMITPLTTLIAAMLEDDSELTIEEAQNQVATALGLNTAVDLTTYDPIKEATASNADQGASQIAFDIQKASVMVSNLIAQAASVVAAAQQTTTIDGDTGKQAVLDAKISTSSIAAVKAIASSIATAAASETKTVNLANVDVLKSIVETTATNSGVSTTVAEKITAMAASVATAISNVNTVISSVDLGGNAVTALTNVVKAQVVAQTDLRETLIDKVVDAVTDATLTTVDLESALSEDLAGFGGEALNNAIAEAEAGEIVVVEEEVDPDGTITFTGTAGSDAFELSIADKDQVYVVNSFDLGVDGDKIKLSGISASADTLSEKNADLLKNISSIQATNDNGSVSLLVNFKGGSGSITFNDVITTDIIESKVSSVLEDAVDEIADVLSNSSTTTTILASVVDSYIAKASVVGTITSSDISEIQGYIKAGMSNTDKTNLIGALQREAGQFMDSWGDGVSKTFVNSYSDSGLSGVSDNASIFLGSLDQGGASLSVLVGVLQDNFDYVA